MKRVLTFMLTAALVIGLALPAFAANGYNGYYNGNDYYYNDGSGYYYGNYGYAPGYGPPVWEMFERPFTGYPAKTITGYIGQVTKADCGNYTAQILDKDGDVQLIVWLLAYNHAVIDATTGLWADLEDHGGGQVLVIYGPFKTLHDTPQTNALVIALNIEEAGLYQPRHHIIEAVEWDESGKSLRLTVDGGSMFVTLNEDTELKVLRTRQIVQLYEFKEGDEVLLWYGFVAMSHPAQATATRALKLVAAPEEVGPGYNGTTPGQYEVTGESIVRVGIELWPVRDNAVKAGFGIYWNTALRRAELARENLEIIVYPGSAVYYVNGEPYVMSAPTLLEGNTLFAPEALFKHFAR